MQTAKRLLCSLMILFIFITSVSVTASAFTADDLAHAAHDMIFQHEGVYTTVLADDNGALSIGKIGWHGRRALQLLKAIDELNPWQAAEMLGEELYNEIQVATDLSWDTRILTEEEKDKIAVLLATEESKLVQDETAFRDIKNYILHGQTMGISDGKVLIYFADLENQMGSLGVEAVVEIAVELTGSVSEITLDDIYDAAMLNETAASSPTRRKSAYDYCRHLSFGSQGVVRVFETGEYRINASSLRVRSGPDTTFDTVTDSVPYGKTVTVTEVSGDWGKIVYKGKTGWISLLYADFVEDSSSQETLPDFNGNGKVDASDARLVLRVAANMEELNSEDKKKADVNSDSRITAADARIILRIAAKIH